jgi:hypothetical protein
MTTPVRLINLWPCVAGYAGAGGDQYNAPQQPQQGSGYGYGHQCKNFLHPYTPPRPINRLSSVAGYAGAGGDQYNSRQQPQQGSGYGSGPQCTQLLTCPLSLGRLINLWPLV